MLFTGGLGCRGRPRPTGSRFRSHRRVRRSEEVALIPAINGRAVISRADMAARGVPPGTVTGWYRDRARTGHPEKAGRIGRTDYWYEDEWTAWHQAYLRGKIESLTEVDRGGDPDDLVDAAEAARMLRYANRYGGCARAGSRHLRPSGRAGPVVRARSCGRRGIRRAGPWRQATGAARVQRGVLVRVMARISMPVESGNQAIKDGTLGGVMQRAAERWKPEAMYFTTFDGQRTAFMVFDLPDASGIPPFAEPFFMELNASVELAPAMNGDDLQKGLSQLG